MSDDEETGTDTTSLNRATYDRIAVRYAERQENDRLEGPSLFDGLEKAFLECVPRDGVVLDVGCGPGFDGARFVEQGLAVIGVDLSMGMLSLATTKLSHRVVQADMRALPLAARSADGVWAVASLLHVPAHDTLTTLTEFHRVLRRGSALALVTAVDDQSGFEAVPYAAEERRWFVYRDETTLHEQLVETEFEVNYRSVIAASRRWATFCAVKR